jgi:hypothetical protein
MSDRTVYTSIDTAEQVERGKLKQLMFSLVEDGLRTYRELEANGVTDYPGLARHLGKQMLEVTDLCGRLCAYDHVRHEPVPPPRFTLDGLGGALGKPADPIRVATTEDHHAQPGER